MSDTPKATRRRFITYGLAGSAAAGMLGLKEWRSRHPPAEAEKMALPLPPAPAPAPPGMVTRRRRLGRTGLDVSVIGIGAGALEGTGPIHRAVAKGINYLDTSCCYGNGSSENLIGRAFRENAQLRDKLVLATKWDASAHMKKERILASLDDSLKRLGTDHVDIMQIHSLGDAHGDPSDDGFARLENADLYAAMDAARSSGKVRFFGATSHVGNRAQILSHAIDTGAFDMLLVKMNFLDCDAADIPRLLQHAKEKDVGVVVMKSQPEGGEIPPGFEQSKWTIYQANLRWALSHDITAVVHSAIGTDEEVQDAAIGAVHDDFTARDPLEKELLERYASALSAHYCRACKDAPCVTACPEKIAIPVVLRAVMYDRRYGWPEQARETYRELGGAAWSERCLSCNRCDAACSYGVDVSARVRDGHRRLGPLKDA
jgi:predicted aldo/keto reductase-like oxidoreductase